MPSLLSFELAARLKSQKTETGTKKAAPQSIPRRTINPLKSHHTILTPKLEHIS